MEYSHPGNSKRLLLALLAIATVLRLSILFVAYFHPERTLTNDSPSYIEPAQYLLRDGAYTHPSALRTPIYPLFLAIIYKLFGERQFYVVLIQVILGLLVIYLTYKLSHELFPAHQNLMKTLPLALGLESILGPFYVMTETLFTFLLVCILLCILAYRRIQNYWWLVACGVLTGLAILCRPIAIYFPVIILLLLIWEYRHNMKQWLIAVVIYVSLVAICIIPWISRNNRVADLPVVSSITGDSLLFYSASALTAHQRHIGFFEAQQGMYLALDQAMVDANLPNTERNRYYMEMSMARQIILQAPATYLYIHMRDSLKIFLPGTASLRDALGQTDQSAADLWDLLQTMGILSALTEYFEQTHGLQLILIPFVLLLVLTCLSSLLGVWVLFRDKNWFELVALSLPVLYMIVLSGPGSYSRFRIPLMPLISILAGIGIELIKNKTGEKNK